MNTSKIPESRKREIILIIPAFVKELKASSPKAWIEDHIFDFQFESLAEIYFTLRYVKTLWKIKELVRV